VGGGGGGGLACVWPAAPLPRPCSIRYANRHPIEALKGALCA